MPFYPYYICLREDEQIFPFVYNPYSTLDSGMQPVIFSVKRYLASGNQLWERSGTSICYYRNGFRQTVADQSYWSLSFT